MALRLILFFAAAVLYAIARYNFFGGVSGSPVWVLNKAVSLAGLGAIAASYCTRSPGWPRRLGMVGAALTALHIVMSLAVFDTAHYPKILRPVGWTTAGIVSIAAAIAATLVLLVPLWTTRRTVRERLGEARWRRVQRFGLLVLALSAVHVAAIGYAGWASPSGWPGFLPPITLISAAIAVWPLVRRLNPSAPSGSPKVPSPSTLSSAPPQRLSARPRR
jgi:DMSO/TMAO reductase YedYZ heme-binding membrane subunit